MRNKPRILVSACLLGAACRYDGRDNADPSVRALTDAFEVIPICPEQLGGLPTPRTPAERRGGRVFTRDGADVTEAFARGADEACRLAALFGARTAVLKARSPSCGAGRIYDGTFSGRLVAGNGVAAQALMDAGAAVFTEEQVAALLEHFDDRKA